MRLIRGGSHFDARGVITFCNDFDASQVKRIYTIENNSIDFIRGWQGHKVEQRWFACIERSFTINVIEIDDFDNPSKSVNPLTFNIEARTLDILHIPSGCITSIKSNMNTSKLLVMADYSVGEIDDEYRFEIDYFNT